MVEKALVITELIDLLVQNHLHAGTGKMVKKLCQPTLLDDIFQFAGQGTAEPCSAMDAEQGSAVHFSTHLKNVQ